jgi:nucleoside-diphosphate-sugar epimerase
MRALISGVAGFIGSHLAEALIREGHEVQGIDAFIGNYDRSVKERNLAPLREQAAFRFLEADLAAADLGSLVAQADWVFHLAAQPGVRASWGEEFSEYARHNVLATQRLLEACRGARIQKLVYASSSSVYGDTDDLPMREDGGTRPVSPYGVTKLAGEHLCYLYWKAFGVPTVSLRYFTVYGPRQRPDMGFHIFMRAILRGETLPIYDDGSQSRDFTFVTDAVQATVAAASYPGAGEVFNIGGGSRVTLNEALRIVEEIAGRPLKVRRLPRQHGDVRHTAAEIGRAKERLGFRPRVSLGDGLRQQWEWMRSMG